MTAVCTACYSQLVTHQRQIKPLVNFDLLGRDLFEVVPCGQEGQCVTWHFSGEYSSFLDVEHINDTSCSDFMKVAVIQSAY